jgi:hypothetical protein
MRLQVLGVVFPFSNVCASLFNSEVFDLMNALPIFVKPLASSVHFEAVTKGFPLDAF